MIESGKLRHRVRIESAASTQNAVTGEMTQKWNEVATVWASIEPLSAKEFIQSSEKQSQVTARIVIRYRDGLDAAMRLVHVRAGRPDIIYNPHGFLADRESGLEYLTIPVSTGTGDGQ